jgi:hypothetical protein
MSSSVPQAAKPLSYSWPINHAQLLITNNLYHQIHQDFILLGQLDEWTD